MTLTTVGYHKQPQTFFGKLSCGLCALCGVFIITLPIPIGGTYIEYCISLSNTNIFFEVVSSFAVCYRNKLWRNEIATRKRLETRLRRQNTKEEIIFHLSKSSGMSGRKILFRLESCVFNNYQIFLKDSEVNRKF